MPVMSLNICTTKRLQLSTFIYKKHKAQLGAVLAVSPLDKTQYIAHKGEGTALYVPFCHGALKLDMSILFTTFFLRTSLQFILSQKLNQVIIIIVPRKQKGI